MATKKKKIAYISGNRADFGLMTPILHAVQKSSNLELQLFATGIHLMRDFGNTVREMKKEFPRVQSIPAVFASDDRRGMAEFTGKFLREAVRRLAKHRPDIMLVLGDRVEMLCTAVACLYLGIPVAHVHGGEKTTTVDEQARHAITKLSHIHFAATRAAGKRIERMGEEAWRIHVVGAPALDVILHAKLPSRRALFSHLGLPLDQKVILLTQHPVSQTWQAAGREMRETISAVKQFRLPVVVAYPHPDAGGRNIIAEIKKEQRNPLFYIFPSLPYKDFLALEREAAVWVGNSSAGMIESGSFHTPVVNIGDRQKGREHGRNVMNVGYDRREIARAIARALSSAYGKTRMHDRNPWGDGKTGYRVAKILEELEITEHLLNKQIIY